MMVEKKLILDDSYKIIGQQLNIDPNEIVYCNDCGKFYTKDMVVKIDDEDEDYLISLYRCLYCQDLKETADGNKHSTEYYRSVLKELNQYKEEHPIEK